MPSSPRTRRLELAVLVLNWEVIVVAAAFAMWHAITSTPDLPAATLIACSQCVLAGWLALVPLLLVFGAAGAAAAAPRGDLS